MSTYRYRLSNYRDLMSKYRKFFDTVKSFFYGTNCWDFDSRHEMCVFFTLNRCFYPSTSSTTSARTDSSILERYELFVHNTTPQRYYIVTFQVRSKRSRQISAMFILLDMTGTAYTFYKNRENKKKRRKGKQIWKNRRGGKKCRTSPQGGCGRHLEKNVPKPNPISPCLLLPFRVFPRLVLPRILGTRYMLRKGRS